MLQLAGRTLGGTRLSGGKTMHCWESKVPSTVADCILSNLYQRISGQREYTLLLQASNKVAHRGQGEVRQLRRNLFWQRRPGSGDGGNN